ncbi:conjugal transfer protein TraP [Morganella psychrotolerans]|uniref:conjugal transfer protein TraP n=1 Tax=Morganella psychrotolerans TaxID=368603 RepID=UPI0039AFAF3A
MTSEFNIEDPNNRIPELTHTPIESMRPNEKISFMQRKLFLGLTFPWLAGFTSILIVAAIYLFYPEDSYTSSTQIVQSEPEQFSDRPVFTNSIHEQEELTLKAEDADARDSASEVKAYAEVNREAIKTLSDTVKAQNRTLVILSQQYTQSQTEIAGLKTRIAELELEQKPEKRAIPSKKKSAPKSRSQAMQLTSIQNGMAWIYYQDKTWAVQEGDRIGNVTVTEIDASGRQVITSSGTVR